MLFPFFHKLFALSIPLCLQILKHTKHMLLLSLYSRVSFLSIFTYFKLQTLCISAAAFNKGITCNNPIWLQNSIWDAFPVWPHLKHEYIHNYVWNQK